MQKAGAVREMRKSLNDQFELALLFAARTCQRLSSPLLALVQYRGDLCRPTAVGGWGCVDRNSHSPLPNPARPIPTGHERSFVLPDLPEKESGPHRHSQPALRNRFTPRLRVCTLWKQRLAECE